MKEIGKILFCGDSFLNTGNGESPFMEAHNVFCNHVVFINLEASLKKEEGSQKKKVVSISLEPQNLRSLEPQIKYVSIINNHAHDNYSAYELRLLLERAGCVVLGPDNPSAIRIQLQGKTVDIIAAYLALPKLKIDYSGQITERLTNLLCESKADIKILSLHWGFEYLSVPAPFQRNLAKVLIDNGASLIVGHHPHVPQGCEVYKGKSVYYSLGNFNFWTTQSEPFPDSKWGYMVSFEVETNDVKILPYYINENYQPNKVGADELYEKLDELNQRIKSQTNNRWLDEDYNSWFQWESGVWKMDLLNNFSMNKVLRFLGWLLLPIQIRFYLYFIRKNFKILKKDDHN